MEINNNDFFKALEDEIGSNWHDIKDVKVKGYDANSYHNGYNQAILDSVKVIRNVAKLLKNKGKFEGKFEFDEEKIWKH